MIGLQSLRAATRGICRLTLTQSDIDGGSRLAIN
jgi:hypothetical protein